MSPIILFIVLFGSVLSDSHENILQWWKDMSVQKPSKCQINPELEQNFPEIAKKFCHENMRKIDKTLLVNATHNLNGLFSGSGQLKSLFRKAGLRIFAQSTFLKNQSMLFAMGLRSLEA